MAKFSGKNYCWKEGLSSLFECHHNGELYYAWVGESDSMCHLITLKEFLECLESGDIIEEDPDSEEFSKALGNMLGFSLGKDDMGGEAAHANPFYFVMDVKDTGLTGLEKLDSEEGLPEDMGGTEIKLPQRYDPKLSNTERTADELAEMMRNALSKTDRPDCISLLFHGVPGTGKTIAAAYLAKQLGIKMRSYNIAEMLGKYVGESEKALTKAFTDCQNHNIILHLDEIDSIASARDGADRQHQIQMVNCLLQNLDTFKGIFIATTNLQDKMDSAVTRRFLLKQEFNNVTADQAQSLARLYFSRKAPQKLPDNVLAPADFNIVKAGLLFAKDEDVNRKYLFGKLMEEAKLRNGKDLSIKKQAMGFL